MATYYYNPPETDEEGKPFPPLVFESDGDTRIVMAHRYWKPMQEEYIVEILMDKFGRPRLDPKGKEIVIKQKKTVYVLDEEMNARVDSGEILKPSNSFQLSKYEFDLLKQQRYAKFREHIVSEESLTRAHRKNLADMRKQQWEEMETEKRQLEEERAAYRAKLRAEMNPDKTLGDEVRETLDASGDHLPVKRAPGRPRKED